MLPVLLALSLKSILVENLQKVMKNIFLVTDFSGF